MRSLERYLLLEINDQRWREHLYDMDYLREGIHLRGFAQIEPLVAYKNEAFSLFGDLMNSIWGDFARMIFHVEVVLEGANGGGAPSPVPAAPSRSSSSTGAGRVSYSGGLQSQGALAMAAAAGPAAEAAEEPLPAPVEQRRVDASEQIGRNDPCWCGSGKKFKKCHGA
jgi:preprotein translocase subunit SecA